MLVSIQYLRAIAALVVVTLHSGWSHTQLGHIGVDIFFVISGFVIESTSRGKQPLAFLQARLIRVAPFYWLMTLAWALVEPPSASRLAASLLFLPTLNELGEVHPVLGVGWTLYFEMFFYLTFAVGMFMGERRLETVTALFVVLVVAKAVFDWDRVYSFVVDPLLFEFLAGAWIFRLRERYGLAPARVSFALIGLTVVFLLFRLDVSPWTPWRFVLWGIPACLLVAGMLGLEDAKQMPRQPLFLLLGSASYSLYLTHLFVVRAMHAPIVFWLPWPAAVALVCAVSCAVAVPMHLWIERPLTDALKSLATPRSARALVGRI